jgi:glycosyltransferase involved in cell wall biosynthesis
MGPASDHDRAVQRSQPTSIHIGLNLIFMVPGETGGMEVAVRESVPALVAAAPGVRFTAFINREEAAATAKAAATATAAATAGRWGERVRTVTVPVNARSRIQWVIGEQLLLPRLAARAGVDLMHSLGSTAPGWGRFCRVVTIHDLIYARYPEAHEGVRSVGMKVLVGLAARRSDRIIAISESTRRDIEDVLAVSRERIDVVPQGVGLVARARPTPPLQLRSELGLGDRTVVLSLSARRPHKNLLALIGALAQIPPERRPLLVLPGYPTWHDKELHARAAELGVGDDVRLLQWLSDEDIEGLWGVADAFVFPSLYEGFGLPVLEAMARGVPVACSNAASLPEVAGDAALLFDGRDETAIAAAIERLLGDHAEADRLRTAGRARVAEFTWQRTAQLTLQSYACALGLDAVPRAWTEMAQPVPMDA